MDNKTREDVALFRYGVISDLVGATNLDYGEQERLVQEKAGQRWNIPNSNKTRISASTIRRWMKLYLNSGGKLSSLYPVERSDRGKSRRVDDDTILSLVKLKKELPNLPARQLVAEMEKRGLVTPGFKLRLSSVYRILKQQGLNKKQVAGKVDRRRYEAEFPNDIWQSDVMHGPSVEINGKKRKTYLIAFIDDHSRLLPHAQFYTSERLFSWLDSFRQALLTRGLPRKLYVDNGAAFRSRHLEKVCASLGLALIHTPPYIPQGRGKIERFFRTVRAQMLSVYTGDTLEDLNAAFTAWVQEQYHQRIHSSTGESPLQRFAKHIELLRCAPPDLEDHFRKEIRRRVAKDRTVSVDGRLYEAPTMLIGEQVRLLYHDHKPNRIEIIHKNSSYGFLLPVDLKVNSKVKRNANIDTLSQTEQPSLPYNGGKLSFSSKEEVKS
jgi:transposase InsO family protein